jgi:Fic family protein
MEPLLPEPAPLQDLALELVREANTLEGWLPPATRKAVAELVRTVNTHHSALIEGHATRPRDIERALAGHFSSNPERRALQVEARAYVEVQRAVDRRLDTEPELPVTSPDVLLFLHQAFYERIPEEWRVVRSADGRHEREVVPGKLRDGDVEVECHAPPRADTLPRFLDRFAEGYDPARLRGLDTVLAAAASHHRLQWIHPFHDANGRVARLFTDAYLRRAGVGDHGLWSPWRGFAQRRSFYREALADADSDRRHDRDGRGARSQAALDAFCRFFLEVCLDQVRFMHSLLEPRGLVARIQDYVRRRASGEIGVPLAKEASHILQEVVLLGEISRGDAARITGMSERTGRRIVSQLVAEGLLVSDTPKGPVRIGLPMDVVGFYFPRLFPDDVL